MTAGRRRRKLNLLTGSGSTGKSRARNRENNEILELPTWSELPIELLEDIVSRLCLEDNIRTSVVCKRCQLAAIAVRVVNRAPLLMFFPKYSDNFEFYDPSERSFQYVQLPQLEDSRACYSKDGWLLLYRHKTFHVFFFNPFTLEMVMLPSYELEYYQTVAFSAPPTSTSCMVFTIENVNPTSVAITICHPGAGTWTTVEYQSRTTFWSSSWNKLVVCNGLFYCRSITGWVGVYNPHERTWSVLSVPPPKCLDKFVDKNWWEGKFLTEKDGDVLLIYTCPTGYPMSFKLDQKNMVWEELDNLDGATIFASFSTTVANINLPAIKSNSIYFSKVRFYGRRCISYSLEDGRYHPRNEYHDWGEEDSFSKIWIEIPQGFPRLKLTCQASMNEDFTSYK